MTKHVEVPEGVTLWEYLDRLGVIQEGPHGTFIHVDDLGAIYKNFCARLLEAIEQSREPTKAALAVLDPDWPSFLSPMSRADMEQFSNAQQAVVAAFLSALQATSIPEVCNCSYDRLVTQEQAFAIRAACPVHGPTPQNEEGR